MGAVWGCPNLNWYFTRDLESRLAQRVRITTDGFPLYRSAVEDRFGANVDFAQLVKLYEKKRPSLARPRAALASHFAWYNFCRVHSTMRVTPSMAAGISNEVWSMDKLLC